MRLRILSLNAGLLQLFGYSLPAPFVTERLIALPEQLRKTQCDIVLLQEVYGHSKRNSLAKSLEDIYPFAFYPRMKRCFGLENALMTLSRFPVSGNLELFGDAPFDESLFDSKGLLLTRHQISKDLALNIVNLHTTAGGAFRHPEHESIDLIRSRQISQVLRRVRYLESPLLIAGDLNAGPGVSESNFRQLISGGFLSVHDLMYGETGEPTWDPQNPLNANGPHRKCPSQRIDHFFVRSTDLVGTLLRPVSSTICMKEAAVKIPGHADVSVSDHYGICLELDVWVDELAANGSTLSHPNYRNS
jgi:endonuclease/exonuclease/phosphatase family metal-dependent hydrolase